jgi:conjugative transposon TraM protein
MKPHSEKFLQKRRFLMVLPLLVLPFVTMIFWALGGGQGTSAHAHTVSHAGLNLSLPDAYFGEMEIWDKLSLYEMAERDSAKYEEARESDPYFDLIAFQTQDQQPKKKKSPAEKESKLINSFRQKERQLSDPNEERVTQKLNELYKEINRTTERPAELKNDPTLLPEQTSDPQFAADVDRLEKMMQLMQDGQGSDPEMEQIEGVLEKILDIQHPDRVKQKLEAVNVKAKANTLPVELVKDDENISLINSNVTGSDESIDSASVFEMLSTPRPSQNGFFGLEDETYQANEVGNAIEAVIHDMQELVAGSTVKMRLLNDIHIKGRLIPKDQFIYGVCAINGERLTVEVSSIRTGNSLLPISLEVYDLDGLPGIYIPGAITRDAAKQASDNALQNIQLMSLDPSIGAQAAAAGVEAAKGLFSKKAKMIKVTVKAGYQVFLVDTNPTTNTTY